MKPHRMAVTNNLVLNYGLFKRMTMIRPFRADEKDMCAFHTEDYVNFLKRLSPSNTTEFTKFISKFNVADDRLAAAMTHWELLIGNDSSSWLVEGDSSSAVTHWDFSSMTYQ